MKQKQFDQLLTGLLKTPKKQTMKQQHKAPSAPSPEVKEDGFTKGEINNNLNDGNVKDNSGIVIASCYSSLLMPATIKANAARIVLTWNNYDKVKADNEKLKATNSALYRTFESLTPGGSEYWNDVAACVWFIKQELKGMKEVILNQKSKNEKLSMQIDDFGCYINYVRNTVSRGAMPLDYEDWIEVGKPLTK